jgi:hypothetical protein
MDPWMDAAHRGATALVDRGQAELIQAKRDGRMPEVPVQLPKGGSNELTGGQLSQATLVSYFKRTFPSILLRVLIESGAWTRVSDGGLTDEQFDRLLGPSLTSLEPRH